MYVMRLWWVQIDVHDIDIDIRIVLITWGSSSLALLVAFGLFSLVCVVTKNWGGGEGGGAGMWLFVGQSSYFKE